MIKLNDKLARCYEKLSRIATPETLAKSVLGREITLFHFGKNQKTLLVGGIHAREWITALLLTALAEKEGESAEYGFDLAPCLNPDGMSLCLDGTSSVPDEDLRRNLLKLNGGSDDFSQWKANASGVDLNVNFDADWGEGRYNVTEPGAANYIGREPCSEPETAAAVALLGRGYSLVASYHSLGEEVYWGYESNFRHYAEAKEYASYVGYALKRSENSSGGLKDYYAMNYPGLGLTVEVGDEREGHPYPEEKLDSLVKKHEGSVKLLASLGERINAGLYGGSAQRGGKSV